jgi:hypothetical protein
MTQRKGKESTTRKDGINIGLVEAEIYGIWLFDGIELMQLIK